jgi:phosphatidylserine/phosphatidylglycerophosphate/cardiolipin synthase-like enzyme
MTRPQGPVELVVNGEHLEQVVLAGIAQARVSVDIMTADFKAMLVPLRGSAVTGSGKSAAVNSRGRGRGRFRGAQSIVSLMRMLVDRGVEIRVLHAGVPSGPALRELKQSLPRGLTIRRCPRLHAKAVVIDAAAMYLGSANLTGAGLGAKAEHRRNFEMGVWTRSADLIDAVMEQFNALWEGARCEGCGRREVCPVPLEEPRL